MIGHIDEVLQSNLVVDNNDAQKDKGKTNDQIMAAADREVSQIMGDPTK